MRGVSTLPDNTNCRNIFRFVISPQHHALVHFRDRKGVVAWRGAPLNFEVARAQWNEAGGAGHIGLAVQHLAGVAGVRTGPGGVLVGAGIGDLPPIVRPDLLASGKLVEVMPGWRLGTETLAMVHLSGRHVARPLRAFMDYAATEVPKLFPKLPQ